MTERRVLLGIASGGSPTKPFLEALAHLKVPAHLAPLERSVAVGTFIPAQRELIMSDALAGAFDYLFFVDDDIVLAGRCACSDAHRNGRSRSARRRSSADSTTAATPRARWPSRIGIRSTPHPRTSPHSRRRRRQRSRASASAARCCALRSRKTFRTAVLFRRTCSSNERRGARVCAMRIICTAIVSGKPAFPCASTRACAVCTTIAQAINVRRLRGKTMPLPRCRV